MFSAFFLVMMLLFALCVFAVITVVGSVFKAAFSIAWLPLKIVGVLVASVVLLAVGVPVLAVAVPVMLVLVVVALPILVIGGLFLGGLGLVGLA